MITFSEHAKGFSPLRHFKTFFKKQTSKFGVMLIQQFLTVFSCRACENLQELGIFKNLKAFIDTDKSPSSSSTGYVVSFDGDELSRITGTIGTEIGQNDGALTAELQTPNIFGRGERLSINYSYSYIRATELNLKLLKPYYHTNLGDYKPE